MNARRESWPADLAACIEEHRATPFAWGMHDCGCWCAAAVQVQTGQDYLAPFRERYRDAKTARALIAGEFGGAIENIPGRLGFEEIPLARCQRGFIVSKAFRGRGTALGICVGTKAVFAAKTGLTFIPMNECRRAWRI
jgi:hypothetical protein